MNETTLFVSGMSCKSCVSRINRAVAGLGDVQTIHVDLGRGLVRIRHAPSILAEQLAAAVSRAGYPATTG